MPASLGSLLLQQRLASMQRNEDLARQELDFTRAQDEQRRKEGILQQQDLLNRLEKMVASDRQQRQATLDRQLKAEELKAKAAATLGKEMEASPYAADPRVEAARAGGMAAGSVLAEEEKRKNAEAVFKLMKGRREAEELKIKRAELKDQEARTEQQRKESVAKINHMGGKITDQLIREGLRKGTPEYVARAKELWNQEHTKKAPAPGTAGMGTSFKATTKDQNAFSDVMAAVTNTFRVNKEAERIGPMQLGGELSFIGKMGRAWDHGQEYFLKGVIPNDPEEIKVLDDMVGLQNVADETIRALRLIQTGQAAAEQELRRLRREYGLDIKNETTTYQSFKKSLEKLTEKVHIEAGRKVSKIMATAGDPETRANNLVYLEDQVRAAMPAASDEEIYDYMDRLVPASYDDTFE